MYQTIICFNHAYKHSEFEMKAILVIHCLIESQSISNSSQLHGVSNLFRDFEFCISLCVPERFHRLLTQLELRNTNAMVPVQCSEVIHIVCIKGNLCGIKVLFNAFAFGGFWDNSHSLVEQKSNADLKCSNKKGEYLHHSITTSVVFAYIIVNCDIFPP